MPSHDHVLGETKGPDFPFLPTPGAAQPTEALLSAADIQHFCDRGFVIVRGFLGPSQVTKLRSEMVDMLSRYRRNWTRDPVPPTPETPMWQATGSAIDLRTGEPAGVAFDAWMKPGDDDPTAPAAAADSLNPHRVQYINGIHEASESIRDFNRDPRLMGVLSQLLGSDM